MNEGIDCGLAEINSPLRQGDILKQFVDGQARALLIVITADCDIAQDKSRDTGLACVQLQSLRSYLVGEHLTRLLAKQIETRSQEFQQFIAQHWQRQDVAHAPLTHAAITEWLSVASAEEIVDALGISEPKLVSYVNQNLQSLRIGKASLAAVRDPEAKLKALANLAKAPPRDWPQFVQSQLARLQPAQLPDDLFFVSSIPGEPDLGFIAILRRIVFVDGRTIVPTVPDAREISTAYVRIGKLMPTFKHGLAQQVGQLFARIGFPKDYEMERDAIFELNLDALSAVLGRSECP